MMQTYVRLSVTAGVQEQARVRTYCALIITNDPKLSLNLRNADQRSTPERSPWTEGGTQTWPSTPAVRPGLISYLMGD